jgi:predicted AAA+ superfamily ATPase
LSTAYQRPPAAVLARRLAEPRRFIQVVAGPRQVGKTTLVQQVVEGQKATGWAESVKRLWDEDTRKKRPLKVVLLGSAPLLIQRGLSESLAGRFEVLHLPHWPLGEMRAALCLWSKRQGHGADRCSVSRC